MARNIVIENARLMFRNFAGEEGKYNRKGDRNFAVQIDPLDVEGLVADGWNVKVIEPKEGYDEPTYYIQVSVSFEPYPPELFLIKHNRMIPIDEMTAKELDDVEIETADLCIRPYNWSVNGKSGTKAYLKSLYVTARSDRFAEKYAKYYAAPNENDEPFPM